MFLTIISLSFSYVIIRTQLSKVNPLPPQSTITENQSPHSKENLPETNLKSNIEITEQPPPPSTLETKTMPYTTSDSNSIHANDKKPTESIPENTLMTKNSINEPKPRELKQETSQKIANKTPMEKKPNIQSTPPQTQSQPSKTNLNEPPSLSEQANTIPTETLTITSSTTHAIQEQVSSQSTPPKQEQIPPQENPLNSTIQTEKELEEKLITAKNTPTSAPSRPVSPPPLIETKELPPSINPEKFQAVTSSQTAPKPEEPIDISKLPVLKTSDRIRLGLENMQLNVLREPGPKNPHGLAIINLTKVYVGEMIPGTPVRLIDVKTHGIAIEVVGTGERYYVPR